MHVTSCNYSIRGWSGYGQCYQFIYAYTILYHHIHISGTFHPRETSLLLQLTDQRWNDAVDANAGVHFEHIASGRAPPSSCTSVTLPPNTPRASFFTTLCGELRKVLRKGVPILVRSTSFICQKARSSISVDANDASHMPCQTQSPTIQGLKTPPAVTSGLFFNSLPSSGLALPTQYTLWVLGFLGSGGGIWCQHPSPKVKDNTSSGSNG